jgi:ABC transporter with metal-binding/Fe-S-binding domain ATP-binding protein
MKLALLLSGGKDSIYAGYIAKTKLNRDIACCITIQSDNNESYMFHTPSIAKTKTQADSMNIPLIIQKTEGVKEIELDDLEKAINIAKQKYKIEGIITGAIQSVYQSSRIQKICDKLNIVCLNPLWQTDEEKYLYDLIKDNFKVIITGVFAYPLNQSWLGREINEEFIADIKKLNKRYKVSMVGEGGEFETFVLNCPLFKKELKIKSYKDIKEGENSWRREINL